MKYAYPDQYGPERNGSRKLKPALNPSVSSEPDSWEELCYLAAMVHQWGQREYARDHGTRDDHDRLLRFLNCTMGQLDIYREAHSVHPA